MPDWTYRSLLRPLLLRLPHETARRLAVGVLRRIAAMPGGMAMLDFFGHMAPDPSVRRVAAGREFCGPVGIGSLVDPDGTALRSLRQFGSGFVEVGPISAETSEAKRWWKVDTAAGAIHCAPICASSEAAVLRNLEDEHTGGVGVWLRVSLGSPERCARIAAVAGPRVSAFTLLFGATDSLEVLSRDLSAVRSACPGVLLLISVEVSETREDEIAGMIREGRADGVVIRGERAEADGSLLLGCRLRPDVLALIGRFRRILPPEAMVVAGGVLEPADVAEFQTAGADLCMVDSGLVLSGPGLLKRCNEAVLLHCPIPVGAPDSLHLRSASQSWFWACMLGLAMLGGGLLALAIASTRVVLPYDEALCGMTRAQLAGLNPRLLPFMAHDRVSLAGVMLAIGVLYWALGWNGIRRGAHWAQTTVVISATSGFFSFFLFLGFGYFDPFHAFVSAILFPMLLLCLFAPLSPPRPLALPEWRDTPAWRRGQWGQLLFVVIGISLTVAGIVLSTISCTSVFVQEDLDYLGTAAAQLLVSSERLIPLVAHDRASLGGMLVASGLGVWLAAQWGFRRGEAWLWRTLKWAGTIAFVTAITVHLAVGYTSGWHLLPAAGGWVLWLIALRLSRDWLLARGEDLAEQELSLEPERHSRSPTRRSW
jgi:dihydroorotate dehydrogenase